MKIMLPFTHPHVIPNLYYFLYSVEHKEDILRNVGNQNTQVGSGVSMGRALLSQ